MQLIPFEGKALPAYLKKFDVAALNAALTAHAGGGFPVISIKGKMFAVVKDGERTVLPNPKDPESPATSIDVVILKANPGTSKVFYAKGYDPESAEKQKPDCYSNDGVAPAADAKNPQAKKCATCVHNQWGAKVTESGKKGKACSDSVRLAVAAAGDINEPMLLRVPPATIRVLGEYGQMLAKRGVGYNMVVTKVAFDQTAESPKLTFKAIGLVDETTFAEIQEVAQSDTVQNILGGSLAEAIESVAQADVKETQAAAEVVKQVVSKAKQVTEEEVESAIALAAPVSTPAPAAKAKPAAKPAPAPTPEQDLDVDLEGVDFDD